MSNLPMFDYAMMQFRSYYDDNGVVVSVEVTWLDDKPLLAVADQLLADLDPALGSFDGQTLTIGPWSMPLEAGLYYPDGKVFRRTALEPKSWTWGKPPGMKLWLVTPSERADSWAVVRARSAEQACGILRQHSFYRSGWAGGYNLDIKELPIVGDVEIVAGVS